MKYIFLALLCLALTNSQSQSDTTKFIFVGDIMKHGPQIRAAEDSTGVYNFESTYQYIAPIIQSYDYAIGNLELTLSNKGKYTGYPRFRSPNILAKNLKDAGFDLLTTANNHSNDGNKYGVENTIEILNSVDIEHTGTFCDSADFKDNYPLIQEINGLKIAFINYTYGTNGLPTKNPTIVNIIEEESIITDINRAKSLNPDLIIGLLHWGWEYNLYPNNYQKKFSTLMFKNGVDLIIGGHPHVVQPIKCIDTQIDSVTTTSNYIAYSLGNFVSNQKKEKTDGGIMVDIRIVQNKNGIEILEPQYMPVWRYIDKSKQSQNYHIIPISKFERDSTLIQMNKSNIDKMNKYVKHIRNHLYNYDCSELKL